jgi:hypothetical protein
MDSTDCVTARQATQAYKLANQPPKGHPMNRLVPLLTLTLLATVTPAAATAAPPPDAVDSNKPASRALSAKNKHTNMLDIELDPIAYAANGFSVHGGWRIDHWRLDVGAFGAELPSFLLSSDAFTSRFAGFGLKLDYHIHDDVGGAFFGIAASRALNTITHNATRSSDTQTMHELSVRVGYEFDLSWGLYLAPWVSVGTAFGTKDVTIDGDTLEAQGPVMLFPTIHLGYRL